jgi:hypothetical protein
MQLDLTSLRTVHKSLVLGRCLLQWRHETFASCAGFPFSIANASTPSACVISLAYAQLPLGLTAMALGPRERLRTLKHRRAAAPRTWSPPSRVYPSSSRINAR